MDSSSYSNSTRWNYFRDLPQRETPPSGTPQDTFRAYGESSEPGQDQHGGFFPPARPNGMPQPGQHQPPQQTTEPASSYTNPSYTSHDTPETDQTPDSGSSAFNFNIQYSLPTYPTRRSLRSWIAELPNDGQVSGSVSSRGGSVSNAPYPLDSLRRPSTTSGDTDSLKSPSSSRASPKPAPGIPFHFPSMALDPLSAPATPRPRPQAQPQPPPPHGQPSANPRGAPPTASGAPGPSMDYGFLGNIGFSNATSHIPPAIPPYQPRSAPPLPIYIPEAAKPPPRSRGAEASDSKIEPLPPSAARFVAIGIDFGTTYSGVSWAFSGDPTDIKDIQQYPCVGAAIKGRDEIQVPTQYDQRTGAWGYLIDKGHNPIKWFKLLLLRDEDIREEIRNSPYLQEARARSKLLGEDGVIDLVADYLRHLWQHCLREIELQIDQQALQNLPFKVALTIPAIWPQYARNMMKQAVRRAGILQRRDIADTTLILVEEPEAAALATLLDRREYPEMGVGETFIVVDCGGGTIDIISYKVMQTTPFVIREAVKGDGKLCGAFMVDDKFENHMKNLSGLKFENCDPVDFRKFVNDEWEYAIKRSFTGSELQPEFYLHPPIKAFSAFSRLKGSNKCVLKRSTIVDFFDDTYQGIRQLINDQNQKIVAQEGRPPKKIILVGGLGSSRYLHKKLQTEYNNIMQPQRAWSAVAHGAVIKLLKNTFSQKDVVAAADERQLQHLNALPEMDVRIARHSYGVETGVPVHMAFPPVMHGVDRISTEPDGTKRVWRMQWYLTQGEVMDNREPVSYKFYEYVTSSAIKQTKFLIYTSDEAVPPHRRDNTCELLCTIHCDYDTPFHELPVVDEGRGLRIVDDMRLTMRFNGEPEWRLQVGKKSTERKVDVQFA